MNYNIFALYCQATTAMESIPSIIAFYYPNQFFIPVIKHPVDFLFRDFRFFRNSIDVFMFVVNITDYFIALFVHIVDFFGRKFFEQFSHSYGIRHINTYKTNDKTCDAYIDYICRSFLFYPFKRYDVKGKRYLESDKKY